jgi:hypothetical protein
MMPSYTTSTSLSDRSEGTDGFSVGSIGTSSSEEGGIRGAFSKLGLAVAIANRDPLLSRVLRRRLFDDGP